MRSWVVIHILCCCVVSGLSPLRKESAQGEAQREFPGWPYSFEGRPLVPVPMTEQEKRFSEGFPGRIGRFTDGERQLILRWLGACSRKLHPSSHCFRGLGYEVHPLPVQIRPDSSHWGSFQARKEGTSLQISERIYDSDGQSWTDVSSWYWSAFLEKSKGPWWAVTLIEVP